jgi:hypothetical protein
VFGSYKQLSTILSEIPRTGLFTEGTPVYSIRLSPVKFGNPIEIKMDIISPKSRNIFKIEKII